MLLYPMVIMIRAVIQHLRVEYCRTSQTVHMWVLPDGYIDRMCSISTTDQAFVAQR